MSIQYTFYNRMISKKDLLEKTNLTIEHHNGSDWIVGGENSNLRIVESTLHNIKTGEYYVDNDNIHELENHGFKDVQNILDELVSKFNLIFYTDNEFQDYLNIDYDDIDYDEEGFNELIKESMMRNGGYTILDFENGTVEIPNRNANETI